MDQAKALKALGHEVRILSNVQLGISIGLKDYITLPYVRYEHELEGVTVYQSFQRGCPKVIRYNVNRWVAIVRSMFKEYVAKYGKPDILHAHCAKWAGYTAMLIAKEYQIPYVITEHLSKLLFEKEFATIDTWQIPLLKAAYHDAACVVPVSEELVDDIDCYFGKDYRWKSISNMIDTDFFSYKSREPQTGRPFRFCCLANNWPLKGYDILLPAFQRLRDSGVDVELHIAGMGTDSASFCSRLTDGMVSYGLVNREKVRELLYQSDALVLASRSEVQPLVLLEAMSTGIPVISTECIPENLRIEGGCMIVPIDNVAALTSAMKQVMEMVDFDGREVSESVKQFASPKVVGQKLSQLFSDIISSV